MIKATMLLTDTYVILSILFRMLHNYFEKACSPPSATSSIKQPHPPRILIRIHDNQPTITQLHFIVVIYILHKSINPFTHITMNPSLSHEASIRMDNGYASDSDATVEQDWSSMFGLPRASTVSASLQVPNDSTCAADEEFDGANIPTSEKLFCLCQLPADDRPYIACDGGCNRWFHYSCLGLLQQDVDLIGEYICRECRLLNAPDDLEMNEAAGVSIPGPAPVTDHDPVVEEYPLEPLLGSLSPSPTDCHSSLNDSGDRNESSGLRLDFLKAMEREYQLLTQPTDGFRAWQHQASLNTLRQLRTPAGLAMGDTSWRNKCGVIQFWLDFEKVRPLGNQCIQTKEHV